MRLDDERESKNIEDRRGEGLGGGRFPIGGRSVGFGTIILVLVALYFGIDPSVIFDLASAPPASQFQTAPAPPLPANDPSARFVSQVLASTEDIWGALFAQVGLQYRDPKLVLFSGATQTGCGLGREAMGPFYCPLDQKVYIDLSFYQDLKNRFHAPGDFAQAYVVAHEIGHHVQNLLGISDKVHSLQGRSDEVTGNQLSVRLELQADCFAGVWANHANQMRNILEPGDIEEALNAATAIGDDRLQRQSQGYVVPESFTHGTSAQRVRWFKQGIESGDLNRCNTFQAAQL